MKTLYPYLLAGVVLCMSCKQRHQQYTNAEIVPNLLTPVSAKKNVVFAAGFTLAWNELRDQLGAPVRNDKKAVEWMNNSVASLEMMDVKDYTKEVKIEETAVTIHTSFKKELTFATPMQLMKKGLSFNGKSVDAFGMEEYDAGIAQEVKVLYFKDEDHFVVALKPADNTTDIILAKGFNKGAQLHVILQQIQGVMRKGTKVKVFNSLRVPVLDMDIATNFKEFEGVKFKAKGKEYGITTAKQEIQFSLDQDGAKVMDKASVEATTDSTGPVKTPPDLNFDKPFVVMLQKKKAPLPYFILKVEDAEIMAQ